jgi:hypothetical protein
MSDSAQRGVIGNGLLRDECSLSWLTGVFKRRMIRAVRTGDPRCAGGRAGPHNTHSADLTRRNR